LNINQLINHCRANVDHVGHFLYWAL